MDGQRGSEASVKSGNHFYRALPLAREVVDQDGEPVDNDEFFGIIRQRVRVIDAGPFVVRGHYRNQTCGPKHGLRRLQWIEPYWKPGRDTDAPILARSVLL